MMTTTFKTGDRVIVYQQPTSPLEHCEEGRVGTFIEYTQPHGFARVELDPKPEWKDQVSDKWLIHPENLRVFHPYDPPDETKHDPHCDCGICAYCNGQEDKYGNPSGSDLSNPLATPTTGSVVHTAIARKLRVTVEGNGVEMSFQTSDFANGSDFVRSVNHHAALVEALVQARNVLYADDPATAKAIAMIDTALAAVGEGE